MVEGQTLHIALVGNPGRWKPQDGYRSHPVSRARMLKETLEQVDRDIRREKTR
jgi:hypothetical protein